VVSCEAHRSSRTAALLPEFLNSSEFVPENLA
jgi:hypothetical protein